MSKRRRGYPSDINVHHGIRIVHADKTGSELTWIGSHREGARRDVGQLHADTIRELLGSWCWLAAELADEHKRKTPQYDLELTSHIRDK